MSKSSILTIVGARPHFVKAAMVCRAIRQSTGLEEILVHTGQHYDTQLSDTFFEELELPSPAYQLGIGSDRQARQLGRMIMAIDEVIEQEKPALVMVYGDTNTTAAGAIAAAKNHIPLAHIEAGLREFNKSVPEEINKLLVDSVSDLYFCPTATGAANLAAAGITEGVYVVGDVGIDLIHGNMPRIEANQQALSRWNLEARNYYFFTCHRAANTDDPAKLEAILSAVAELEAPVLFPVHPRTRQAIARYGLGGMVSKPPIIAIPPLGFWDTQTLIRYSRRVLTDSGGVIKEAYFHRVPGIILDVQTEWVETVEEGWNQIAGPDREKILSLTRLSELPDFHSNCLGDGRASERVVEILEKYLHAGS